MFFVLNFRYFLVVRENDTKPSMGDMALSAIACFQAIISYYVKFTVGKLITLRPLVGIMLANTTSAYLAVAFTHVQRYGISNHHSCMLCGRLWLQGWLVESTQCDHN